MTPQQEAEITSRYLLNGQTPDATSIALYAKAISMRDDTQAGTRDKKIVSLAFRRPWLLPLLDSAAALSMPNGLLRQKLLLMSAILETRPQYAHLFLPRERGFFYLFYIFFVGCRAVCKAAAGKLILLFV
ncbi:MAG: hypothetical protein MUC87_15030 [Bacteroidia bacterium]|jgi:hypothetical protein|nr:hypothetical protein [Bacteroidia bacterium]